LKLVTSLVALAVFLAATAVSVTSFREEIKEAYCIQRIQDKKRKQEV